MKFGKEVLCHPLLVEAIETEFVPLAIYNNKPGEDKKVLDRYQEAAWNNPVVRFLDPSGKDLIPRKDGVWTDVGIAQRMAAALEAGQRDVPRYLQTVIAERDAASHAKITFAMFCYYEGEAKLGSVDGVIRTQAGIVGRHEVVEVTYNPRVVKLTDLVARAKEFDCTHAIYVHGEKDLAEVKQLAPDKAKLLAGPVQSAPDREQKVSLYHSAYGPLPLTPMQATKVNSALRLKGDPSVWLSPRQQALLVRIQAVQQKAPKALAELRAPDDVAKLAAYQTALESKLAEIPDGKAAPTGAGSAEVGDQKADQPAVPKAADERRPALPDGLRAIEGAPEDGLKYRILVSKAASKEQPHRLMVWLHPSGGSMNNVVERLAPRFAEAKLALVVFTQKDFRGWSQADAEKLQRTLDHLGKVEGLSSEKPFLLGYSAGGQMALILWKSQPSRWGGLILDAAYPVKFDADRKPSLADLPADAEAIKKVPMYVLVGSNDGGARIWQEAEKKYREAGVPLQVEYVEGQGHTWLVGKAQVERLSIWLGAVAGGKLPAATIGQPAPPRRVTLGISLDEKTRITQVIPDSPADKAGMKAGDVIEAIEERVVENRQAIITAINAKAPGDKLKLRVSRDGKPITVEVTLGAP